MSNPASWHDDFLTKWGSMAWSNREFRPVLFLAFAALASFCTYGDTAVKPWCSLIGTALVGWNSSFVFAKTHKLCHLACLESPGCESANYWLQSKMCELNNVSHSSVAGSHLVEQTGSIYTYDTEV